MPAEFEKSDLNRIRRVPQRGMYDQATVYAILDAALIGHVSFVVDEQPFVIPTLIARVGDELLLHGATTSRLMRHAAQGEPLAVGVTHVDGLVLARSVFHHSVNYRSAVVFGRARPITERTAKLGALRVFTERLVPGRWADARLPNAAELQATAVVALAISAASAKVRSGPPGDDEGDYDLPVWAGVLPLALHYGAPQADPRLDADIALPDYLRDLLDGQRFVAE